MSNKNQQAQLSNDELNFKHFLLSNIDKFDAAPDKEAKAEEIFEAVRFYFTTLYANSKQESG